MDGQNYQVYLNFKDDASGKFIKATDDMIASMKKLGLTIKKEGGAVAVDMDKAGQNTQQFGRHMRTGGVEADNFRLAMGSLRNQILVYMFALRPVIEFTKNAIKESEEYERAVTKLSMSFANSHKGNADSIVLLKAYADQLQSTTGYAEHEVVASAAMLATMKLSDTQINQILPSILDLNTALRLGGDENSTLADTAKVVGRALEGNTMTLERMGIKLDTATKKTKDFDSILKAIKSSTAGMSAAMGGTFEGQMKIMGAAWNDFSRAVGDSIIKSPVFIAYIRMLTGDIRTMSTELNNTRESTNNFKTAWTVLITAMNVIGRGLQTYWRGFLESIQLAVSGIYKIGEGLSWLIIQWKAYRIAEMEANSPWETGIIAKLQAEKDAAEGWKKTFHDASTLMNKDSEETRKNIIGTYDLMLDDYGNLTTATKKVETDQADLAKLLDTIHVKTKSDIGATYDGMYEMTEKAVTGMRDLFTDTLVDGVKTGFKNMSDIVSAFGDMMLKTIMQVIVMQTMIRAGLGGFLGFPGGIAAHTGGYINGSNASYGYGPRKKYHSGGEVNATLLEGEGILNRGAMASLGVNNLDKLNRGEKFGGGTVNNYYISAIDTKSFRDRLSQNGDIYQNSTSQGFRDNGMIRKVSQRLG